MIEVYPTRAVDRPSTAWIAGAMGGAAPLADIGFRVERQTQSFWCWAAVSASVARHFGDGQWSQCRVASAETGGDCCADGGSYVCNQPYYLDAALKGVGHLRAASVGYMPAANVVAELELDRPVCLRVEWWDRSGHFLAIAGVRPSPGGGEFLLTDPIFGESRIQATLLLSGGYQAARGTWKHSYVVQP